MKSEGMTRDELVARLERVERDNQRLGEILAESSMPFAAGTHDGRFTRVNRAFCELIGYSAEQLLDGELRWNVELTPLDWRDRQAEVIARVIESETPERFEQEILTRSGDRVTIEAFIHSSGPNELYAFITDITARKQRERNDARYRQLIEGLPSGVVHVSLAGEITVANDEAQRILGLSYDAMTRRYVNDWEGETLREDGTLLPVEEYPVSRCLMTGEAQGPTMVGVRRPDGVVSWALYSARPDREGGELVGAVVAFRDVTDWRRAEESVRLLSATIEQSPVSVMMTDIDANIVYVNAAFTANTGYAREDVTGLNARVLGSGTHGPEYYEDMWRTVLAGQVWRRDICNRRKDGELYWELMSIAPVRSYDGEIRHFVAMKVDDTERRLAEQALGESEERFQLVTQTARDPIIGLDERERIAVWNRAAHRVFGYTADEALGARTDELGVLPGVDAEPTTEGERGNIETVGVRKDGSEFPAEVSIARARRGDSWSRTLIVRDVTERKRLEREIMRISKLESLGVLAGGIAHDFNNVLTGIVANISMASHKLDSASPLYPLLSAATDAAQRATGLTRQLLTFSKGGAPIKKLMSLHMLADSIEFVLRGSNVRCELSFPPELWPVEADAGQLEQVVQNLVINADQAMPDGGVVRVSAVNRRVERGALPPLAAGPHVEIAVEDHGYGIPAEHLDRIFDPYFTTKQRGSGLGLATVYSVVKNHQGHLTVSSELGAGTVFRLYLPAREIGELPAEDAPAPADTPRAGRILVMDDDAGVRQVAAASLRERGFEVDAADDGAEAVDRYHRAMAEQRPYHLVILDLTVPGGMGGLPTLEALVGLDPDVRALVSSGYSDDPVMATPERFGFRGGIAKPFTFDGLIRAVEECLDDHV